MSNLYDELLLADKSAQQAQLDKDNELLQSLSAQERIAWALECLPKTAMVSSSFGVQAALMLHLTTQAKSDIAVVLTDTGYLFPETYRFADELTERLKLNLKVFKNPLSPAWQEAKYGKLWEKGIDGIDMYNKLNKVEPMQQALKELNVGTWFSGLRAEQSDTRANLPILSIRSGVYKFLPVVDWSIKQVRDYLIENDLPYHPLYDLGYVSIGDTHTSRPLTTGEREQDTRFLGLKRECGLHWEI